jgi:hypothetical protein
LVTKQTARVLPRLTGLVPVESKLCQNAGDIPLRDDTGIAGAKGDSALDANLSEVFGIEIEEARALS